MTKPTPPSRSVRTLRRVARIWSILVAIFILLMFFLPGTADGDSDPIPAADLFLLSLTGVAILGLFFAWRWERAGGIFTIAMLFAREIAWVILKGDWLPGFLILWLLIAPPAILFLIAWRRANRENSTRAG